ncbi:MAG: FtsX-like permease family protein [Lachnospiraceae bacterium]|nr:FtsX-like permease family protein [Lachnospiraceae bacterium]
MRSYLSLVSISAKVRRRQNRMTLLCIIISVFLVTAIFSVAEMTIRTESEKMEEKHGSWHIRLENISQDTAKEISQRSDVTQIGWSQAFNLDVEQPYYINEKRAALYGSDEAYAVRLANALEEGRFPQKDNEAMLSVNAKLALNVQIGDRVTLHTPGGDADFTVSGFGSDDKKYYQGQTYLVAVYMTQPAFTGLMEKNGIAGNPTCYVQFQNAAKASKAISEISQQYNLPEGSISENTAVMGVSGQSSDTSMQNFYGIAAVLFVLVLLAGVLMISGSLNSNVAQRTKFFGMMRCIGASRQQIIRFVRLEALNWCKTAVPIGLIFGTIISWVICAVLRYGIGGEFSAMPVFKISPVGLISGVAVGIVTVLLAAQSPAKRAAKTSPISAVSGNAEAVSSVKHGSKRSLGRIERTLGVHHATASGKNWFLMTASFALSIILFLCFSLGMDFAQGLMPALKSWQPDITLNGYRNALVLEQNQKEEIGEISGVKQTFASSYLDSVPVVSSREGIDHINLESYDDFLLERAKEDAVQGDVSDIIGDSGKVMTVYNKDNPLKVGDTLQIGGEEVEITCAVPDGLFPSELLVICSQETFERLTGEQNYTMIGIQLNEDADDETVKNISNLADRDVIFMDSRELNRSSHLTYLATKALVYGFLAIIGLITMFYIINSISISVSARIKQYGAMRAVGMDGRQLTRMIFAEAFTYAVSGLIAGSAIGISLHYFLYTRVITRYFGKIWHLPVAMLCVIIVFVAACASVAVYAPAKRVRNMAITDTINEL